MWNHCVTLCEIIYSFQFNMSNQGRLHIEDVVSQTVHKSSSIKTVFKAIVYSKSDIKEDRYLWVFECFVMVKASIWENMFFCCLCNFRIRVKFKFKNRDFKKNDSFRIQVLFNNLFWGNYILQIDLEHHKFVDYWKKRSRFSH